MFPAYAHLSAYDRHKKIINDYFLLKGGSALNLKRDTYVDQIRRHIFIFFFSYFIRIM